MHALSLHSTGHDAPVSTRDGVRKRGGCEHNMSVQLGRQQRAAPSARTAGGCSEAETVERPEAASAWVLPEAGPGKHRELTGGRGASRLVSSSHSGPPGGGGRPTACIQPCVGSPVGLSEVWTLTLGLKRTIRPTQCSRAAPSLSDLFLEEAHAGQPHTLSADPPRAHGPRDGLRARRPVCRSASPAPG